MIGTLAMWMLAMMQQQAPSPGPGVPRPLAEARAARVSDLRYELSVTIPATMTEPVMAAEIIRFALSDSSSSLALDFSEPADRISALSLNGKTVAVQAVDGHVILPAGGLVAGANEVRLVFRAGDASLNRNPEYLYTLFVPARAHLAIPCFDQPDLKAKWTLALDVPAGWQALANGAETSRAASGGRLKLTFAETPPLSTYLFAFAAGRFSIETAERHGRTFRMFHRETDTAKVARNRAAIFDLHASALAWLEAYTGIPYPWGKFDFLLVPSFQFGGMEHAGALAYNASGLLLDQSATQNQLLARASVIAHETAHMWFGDLVTMRWFNDVWMKEVFANFMAAKIVNPSFPGINHELRFLYANYPTAYDVDRTTGTNAIRQPLDNLDEAGTLYGAIIYQKAPIVMRQLERILGETPFRDGLREYLRGHSFANATWSDLVALLDARTPEDLAGWSRAWVDEPGRPMITTTLRVADGRIAALAFQQSDPVARRGLTWTQRLQVLVSSAGQVRTLPVNLSGATAAVPGATGLPAPDFILPTGEGVGYGGFVLDPASRTYLLAHLPEIADPLTRGAAWVTLWEEMLDGRVAPAALLDLSLRALPLEQDELTVARILGYTEQAYWKFVDEPTRTRVTPDLERVLRAGLDRSTTASLKSAWFSTLRDTARSAPVVGWLERVWRKTETIPGLPFAEPDDIALALELAVREVPAWQAILDQQLARTENPDRKARFAFVRPALSPDQATRDAFFESLKDPANRRHEPWVLEGVAYLHHPLRAAASERYIAVSLGMLREIQRTGDIFFPKRWADATLRGHASPTSATIVTSFIAALPRDYPDRLRRVVLSAADDLLRAPRGR
ncbi:MAG: M1 family aminopeptidase [Vicinamibacterales bacterium]